MAQELEYVKRERERKGYFNPTPAHLTEALLRYERFNGRIWEPAAGAGHISRVLEDHGLDVYSSDIKPRGNGIVAADFFDTQIEVDHVVSNPPWYDYEEIRWHFWITHALEVAKKKVALLMPVYFWDSARRRAILSESPLQTMYIFVKFGFNQHALAWWVWNQRYGGRPQIRWIK